MRLGIEPNLDEKNPAKITTICTAARYSGSGGNIATLHDGGLLRGKITIFLLNCKLEFTSSAASKNQEAILAKKATKRWIKLDCNQLIYPIDI